MYENIDKQTMIKTLFGCEIEDIKEDVIISPIWSLSRFTEKAEKVIKHFKGWYRGVSLTYGGKGITVINSCIGAPLTGDCVIALGYTYCKNILFSGSAGGINNLYNFGDIVVSDCAVIGEGFSRFHKKDFREDCFGEEVYGSKALADVLFKKSNDYGEDMGVNVYKGKIFSTDSILGENKKSFGFMMEKGCDGVEMELSAVFTASKAIGRNAAGLITISDLPLKYKSLFEGVKENDIKAYEDSAKMLPEILMEAVLDI